jgi:hypothetical protein
MEFQVHVNVVGHFFVFAPMHGELSFSWHMSLQRNNKGGDGTGVAMRTRRESNVPFID